jgi:hypothetical protein
MKIGKYCFADNDLRQLVDNSLYEGICECTNIKGKVIDTEDDDYEGFVSFFSNLLCLYVPDCLGRNTIESIDNDFHLFESDDIALKILSQINQSGHLNIDFDMPVRFIDEIQNAKSKWDNFKDEVMNRRRFLMDDDVLEKDIFMANKTTITINTKLFRARRIPSGKDKFRRPEMGCPPVEKATAGRANPIGIPYLYLCEDKKTPVYEVRALYLDRVCLGTFKTKENISVVDFTNEQHVYSAYENRAPEIELSDIVKTRMFFSAICNDLSEPLHPEDSEVSYVPTQWLCEFCKVHIKADGIRFNSSLYQGINVVLFDESKVKCTSIDNFEIKHYLVER